jgi:hypothetical protein
MPKKKATQDRVQEFRDRMDDAELTIPELNEIRDYVDELIASENSYGEPDESEVGDDDEDVE